MTKISWDNVGDRLFETGLDRGVLYLEDNTGVAWNGLTSASIRPDTKISGTLYFDGVKRTSTVNPGNYSGVLKAITYPDEFMDYDGTAEHTTGVFVDNQNPKRFGLSYRTLIGNDVDGVDFAYKVHILYNLTAIPNEMTHKTLGDNIDPLEFSWKINSVPTPVSGRRPTAHFILDSRSIEPATLSVLEDLLYGTETTDPVLPSFEEVLAYFVYVITNNGDGTWTANGPDQLISSDGNGLVTMDGTNAIFITSSVYDISSTFS